jgi:predicted nucleic acid-binding protein
VIFLDTSVLVAIAQVDHVHHAPSRELWNGSAAKETTVSAHTLAEFYSSVTSMPPGIRLSGRDAILALEMFLRRIVPIALTSNEYIETLKYCSTLGLTGGTIHDALHIACARKVNAERIYTWNLKHFRRAAPDLAERIAEPGQQDSIEVDRELKDDDVIGFP